MGVYVQVKPFTSIFSEYWPTERITFQMPSIPQRKKGGTLQSCDCSLSNRNHETKRRGITVENASSTPNTSQGSVCVEGNSHHHEKTEVKLVKIFLRGQLHQGGKYPHSEAVVHYLDDDLINEVRQFLCQFSSCQHMSNSASNCSLYFSSD